MNRIHFIVFLIFILWTATATAVEIRLVYSDEELSPFTMGNGIRQPNPPGIYIDLINQVARELKITVKYDRQPVKRAQLALENGEADGYFSLSFKPDRLKIGQYPMKNNMIDGSRRIGIISYHLYKLKKNPVHWNGKTLTNAAGEIGTNLGYSIAEEIRKMGFQVSEVKTTTANLKKLQLGRICGFAGQSIDTDALIKTGKFGKILKIEPPLASKDYFLIFSNQFMNENSALAEKFWTKLGEIRDKQTKKNSSRYLKKVED